MNACLKLATWNELTATHPSAKVSHVGVQPERKEKTQIFQLLDTLLIGGILFINLQALRLMELVQYTPL